MRTRGGGAARARGDAGRGVRDGEVAVVRVVEVARGVDVRGDAGAAARLRVGGGEVARVEQAGDVGRRAALARCARGCAGRVEERGVEEVQRAAAADARGALVGGGGEAHCVGRWGRWCGEVRYGESSESDRECETALYSSQLHVLPEGDPPDPIECLHGARSPAQISDYRQPTARPHAPTHPACHPARPVVVQVARIHEGIRES